MIRLRALQPQIRGALLTAVAWTALSAGVSTARGPVAVIVHRSNPLNEITATQLMHIYLGDQTRWSDNRRITVLLLPRGSDERRTVLGALLKMSDDDFTRHWISKVFRGDVTSGPKTSASAASILKLTADLPAALGIVNAEDVPAGTTSVKILRVDGKAPGDEGYPLVR